MADGDDVEKPDKPKEDGEQKPDAEHDAEKKKTTKKAAADADNENGENKDAESGDGIAPDTTEADEMLVDEDNGDGGSPKKDDDKEKRLKKFVRLLCVHCRIESATFKVRFKASKKCRIQKKI